MPPSLDNPFRKPPRSKKEAEELSNLLVGKEVDTSKTVKDAKVIELDQEELERVEDSKGKAWIEGEMKDWMTRMFMEKEVSEVFQEKEDGTWSLLDDLFLPGLEDLNDFPPGIDANGKSLFINNVHEIPEGFEFPINTGTLFLNGIDSAKNLKLPEGLKGVGLDGISKPKGLFLPEGIKTVQMNSLSIEGVDYLELPESVETLSLDTVHFELIEKVGEKFPNIDIK